MRSQNIPLSDGAETVIEWFGDDQASTQGVIVFFPALGVPIRYYHRLAEAWSGRGYRIALVETRGQPQSSIDDVKRHNFGYREVVTVDMVSVMKAIREEVGDEPVYLAGHSLGGQFALMYASRFDDPIDGIILIAAGSNYHRTLSGTAKRLARHINIRLTRLINKTLRYFPGDKLGFGGRQPLNMMNDWSFEGLNGRYRVTNDSFDYDAALENLKASVLMVSLEGDPLVPRSCADFLAAKLSSASVHQHTLEAKLFGRKAASHFGWAKQPDPVLDALDTWVGGKPTSTVTSSPESALHEA